MGGQPSTRGIRESIRQQGRCARRKLRRISIVYENALRITRAAILGQHVTLTLPCLLTNTNPRVAWQHPSFRTVASLIVSGGRGRARFQIRCSAIVRDVVGLASGLGLAFGQGAGTRRWLGLDMGFGFGPALPVARLFGRATKKPPTACAPRHDDTWARKVSILGGESGLRPFLCSQLQRPGKCAVGILLCLERVVAKKRGFGLYPPKKANHHCSAFMIGNVEEIQRDVEEL